MRKSLILQLAIQILLLIPRIYSESYCEIPCPLHAECTRDDHCECDIGYEQFISEFNGLPSCRALCDQPCGKHGICTEPNQCACIQGYTKVFDQCLPTCTSGCPNGNCVAPEMCDCDEGHESVDGTCKELNDGSADSSTDDEDEKCKNGLMWYNGRCIQTTTTTSTTVSNIRNDIHKAEETEETTERSHIRNGMYRVEETEETTEKPHIRNGIHRVEESEDTTVQNMFDLDGMVDDNGELNGKYIYSTQGQENDDNRKCPAGYIFHKSECRPEIEVKNACNLELCGPNTKCVDYEKCDCLPGFSWHYVDGGRSLRCASAEQSHQEHLQIVQSDRYKHGTRWLNIFYTSLGVCCALAALLFLLFTLFKNSK